MPGPATPKRAGLGEAVFAFLLGTLLSGIGIQAAAAAVGYRQGSSQPVPLAVTVFGLLGLWTGLVGGVVAYSRFRGSGDLRADVGLYFKWPFDAVVGVVVGVGTQLGLIQLLYLPFERADPTLRHRLEAPAKSDISAVHGWQVVVLVLFLAVGAPLVEELFFRGLILGALTRWLGPVVGVVGSALLFGLAHFQLLQLPALILFGLILGLLAYKTGRLGPGIVAHAAFNAVTVVTLVLAR